MLDLMWHGRMRERVIHADLGHRDHLIVMVDWGMGSDKRDCDMRRKSVHRVNNVEWANNIVEVVWMSFAVMNDGNLRKMNYLNERKMSRDSNSLYVEKNVERGIESPLVPLPCRHGG